MSASATPPFVPSSRPPLAAPLAPASGPPLAVPRGPVPGRPAGSPAGGLSAPRPDSPPVDPPDGSGPAEALAALRRRVEAIGTDGALRALAEAPTRQPLGHAEADQVLGGGLQRGALHEVGPAAPGDMAAAAGFALALAARLAAGAAPWIWVRQDLAGREMGEPYGPGLAAFGLDPARLVLVAAADTREALRAAEESLRCPALACVLLEPWGEARALDLTALRRLALAAEASGVTLLLLRSGLPAGAAGRGPSGALTRWSIAAAPSLALPAPGGLPGMGRPALETTLLRNRQAGRRADGGRWIMEWSPDERLLAPQAPPALARPAPPADGPAAAPGRDAGGPGLRRAG